MENCPGYFGENLNNAISYSPYAFGVALYGNNDYIKKAMIEKTYRYRKDKFVFFILPFLLLRTFEFRSMLLNRALREANCDI